MTVDDSAVEASLRAGLSGAAAARTHGIDLKRVHRIAKASGITLPKGRGYRPAVREEVLAQLGAGEAPGAVSTSTGVHIRTIQKWAAAAGIVDDRQVEAARQRDAVLADLPDAASVKDLCRRHNVGSRFVVRVAAAAGVALPATTNGPHGRLVRERVLSDLRAGMTAGHAAEAHGVSRASTAAWAKREGIVLLGNAFPAEVKQEAVGAVCDGGSIAAVAAETACHEATLRLWCAEAGVRVPGSKHPDPLRAEAVALAHELGSAAAAARVLRLPAATVVDWCDQSGLDLSELKAQALARARLGAITDMQAGVSAAAAARTHKVHPTTVRQWAREAGIVLVTAVPAPIVVRDVAELRARARQIVMTAEKADVASERESHLRRYVEWCEQDGHDPLEAASVATYLGNQLRHGRSGRPDDYGELTGWSVRTLAAALRPIKGWIHDSTGVDVDVDPAVVEVLRDAAETAPSWFNPPSQLSAADIAVLVSATPPAEPPVVLRARAGLLLSVALADLEPAHVVWAVCATPMTSVTVSDDSVSLVLPKQWSRSTTLAELPHRDVDPLECAHCAVVQLHDVAVAAGSGRLGGDGSGCAPHARDLWARAAVRAGVGEGLAVPSDARQLLRLSWHLSKSRVRLVRLHAILAMLVTTGWTISKILALDLVDVERVDGAAGRRWGIRRGPDDRHGRPRLVGVRAASAPGFDVAMSEWLLLRGDSPGPLFPGECGATTIHSSSVLEQLKELLRASPLEIDRIGTGSFRGLTVEVLAARGVHPLRIARRLDVSPQRAEAAFHRRPGAPGISELLNLDGGEG